MFVVVGGCLTSTNGESQARNQSIYIDVCEATPLPD